MRLLIIGRLNGHIGAASRIAVARGAKVTQADDIKLALELLRSGKGADMIMIDVSLDTKELTTALKTERFNIPVVACGINTDSETAVNAIKSGAKEYIPMPPDSELIAAILETIAHEENTLVHSDPAMKHIIRLADQIAPSDASILITGESGTGKEVMARYIHNKSNRSKKQFISLNCAAIPENLLESELFGHEKGSFTGAIATRIGKFEEANGGTLLLDEISEMHHTLQAKLLRAIQERVIDRVGGSKPIPVNIRIIATSNRDLEEEVKNHKFREDLYFRLNVVPIELPPLRKRPMDIEPLATHFVQKYCASNNVEPKTLTDETKKVLRQCQWKGNIRELENTIHRGVLLSQSNFITPEDLNLGGIGSQYTPDNSKATNAEVKTNLLVGRTVSEVERDLILGTLTHCLGNRTQAANILGISIRTLRNKLHQYTSDGFQGSDEHTNIQEAV